MKVGDLVVLSAAGKKNKGNKRQLGGFGVIMQIDENWHNFPYKAKWFKDGEITHFVAKEYEIKKLKASKSNKK